METNGCAEVFKVSARASPLGALLAYERQAAPFTSPSIFAPHQSFNRSIRFLNLRMSGMVSSLCNQH
ncbi:hypothetical protein [Bradyrhizobium yuanmingense]|uniref:hypothetical protein n=1 Tax=Bradyrhizobium yuanmingense TaxID=108015 RepID=UPI0023B99893|nr:hypothetical protein [Bradyrhizobium yuanmingense]MDF0584227.1 hypothetical protein [Bradyrhizobium yuanmingense]